MARKEASPFVIVLVGAIFGLIGLGMLGGSIYSFMEQREFATGAKTAQGTVVNVRGSRGSKGGTTYKPVVVFKIPVQDENAVEPQGQPLMREVEIIGSVASNPPAYSINDTVNVLYHAEHPELGRIDSFMERHFVSALLSGMGLVFFLVGFGLLWSSFKTVRGWMLGNSTSSQ